MSYGKLIDRNIEHVYQTGIATKILQHMDRIRNVSDISQARRWVMELFQNSRDVAYEDCPVNIKIVLEEDRVTFSHNGRPFRVKDILSIINQVSSKSPGDSSVGQFGTGFMTTYQLSEVVDIQGVMKEGELPCRSFCVRIDRRGTTKEEILEEIFKTMEQLREVDESGDMEDFCPGDFNTSFIYHLDSQESRDAARIGVEDLQETILYILLFSRKIASVEVVRGQGEGFRSTVFLRGKEETEGGLKRLSVEKTAVEEGRRAASSLTAVWLSEGDLSLAAGWDETGFLPMSSKLPRIFVDFPLIGTENFPFPVVINCRNFRVNESRSGITLVDNETSRDAVVNKEIMDRAVELYRRFLESAVETGYRRPDHIISIPEWTPSREMSGVWVEEHLYGRLYDIVSAQKMIRTGSGTVSFNQSQLHLLMGDTCEEVEALRGLVQVLNHIQVPVGEDDWLSAFAGYSVPESKYLSVEDVADRAQDYLLNNLAEDRMGPLAWCQNLYRTVMNNPKLAVRVRAGEISLFPNQDQEDWSQRRLFDIHSIRRDPDIPEILKNVSDVLDVLEGQHGEEPLRLRKTLLRREFDHMGLKELENYDRVRLYNHILRRSSKKYGVRNYGLRQKEYEQAWTKAWQLLLACGEDREFYQLSGVIYGEELPPRNIVDDSFYDGMWRSAYHNAAWQILDAIEKYSGMEALCQGLLKGKTKAEVYQWLNKVYGKALLYMGETSVRLMRAFPNQKGMFRALGELKEDCTSGERLKKIAEQFADQDGGCDVYEYALDRKIVLNGVNLPTVREEEVALKINRVVQHILSTRNLSDASVEHQEACTALLGWIQENTRLAERYFPGFSREEEQMRLLTPKAAVRIQRKAMECQTLLDKLGASTAEEAMEKLSALREQAERESHKERENAENPDKMMWEDISWEQGMDEEFGAVSEERQAEICREIGIGGERFALEKVKEYFVGQNYVEDREDGEEIWLHRVAEEPEESGAGELNGESREKSTVRIFYPDNRSYHQAGWDIQVTVTEDGKSRDYYLEVKTHTPRSIRKHVMYLSNEQMKAAVRNRDRYGVLAVIYNYSRRQGEQVVPFMDPLSHIAGGTIVNRQKGYEFEI